ncbi:fimbrial protein [Serratia fonticola]|uniref:fimbrial protein n=1 Tax=Serratia fonticola TaxID=47917 RepID=UPI0013770617|nr:type 1 fimbrial protein [Serratia fonticola]NCG54964.1 hypothetical protein [Serratia fonticola]
MRKTIFTLTPVALVLLAMAGNVQAASNAQITITANVTAVTCDVSLSTNNLDLGNWAPTAFPAAVATPITASQQTFTVGLSNCGTPAASKVAGLTVTGPTLGGNPNLFNSTGTNTGIMLNLVGSSTYINNADILTVATADGTTPTAGDFNSKSLSLQAGLASTATTGAANIGAVSAPILFAFNYN